MKSWNSYMNTIQILTEHKWVNWDKNNSTERDQANYWRSILSKLYPRITRKHSCSMRTNRAITRPSREPVSMRLIVDRQTTVKTLPFLAVGKYVTLNLTAWSHKPRQFYKAYNYLDCFYFLMLKQYKSCSETNPRLEIMYTSTQT